ncbi:hypothetical protein LCGC14_2095880 [marine sediment metagenome]|uniref:Uncharacterized protein n=1 Tax=marine sediment metagenome TaxID=412755 RepID=A0A0F9EYR7_9ZZZZ
MTDSKDRLLKWIRTNDAMGFKANFDVICHHCNEPMFLRGSELKLENENAVGFPKVAMILRVMYKCIPCAQVYWFHVSRPYIDADYWNKVMKWRNMHPMWVPPPETWSEDARVQKRLKDLGYIGGNIEYKDITDIEEK